MPALDLGNGIVVSALFVFLVAMLGWRMLFNRIADSRHLEERILIVGTGERRPHGGAPDSRSSATSATG